MRFTEHLRALIAARAEGECSGVMDYTGKLEGRALAEGLGIRTPRIISGPCGLQDWPDDPHRSVVIKPVDGCNARGVFPLLFDGEVYAPAWDTTDGSAPWPEWKIRARAQRRKSQDGPAPFDGPWIVEELLTSPDGGVVFDWKCYCIWGRCIWIRQHHKTGRSSNACRVRSWTPDFGPIDEPLIQKKQPDPTLPPPRHGPEIVDAAEAIATALRDRTGTPFVRIDMYEDNDGPLFGEITPHPSGGRQVYHEAWDQALGCVWEALAP